MPETQTDPTLPSSVKPGDEVRIFDSNRRHVPGGWEGRVVKVGRTLAHITYLGSPKPETFLLQTGMATGPYSGHRRYRTLAAVAISTRRTTALAVLHAVGLDVDHRVPLGASLEVLEAAALAVAAYLPEPKEDQP